MEDGRRPNIYEEEIIGLNINIEEIESNEHRKRMESLELVEHIRILNIEVNTYIIIIIIIMKGC
jgi:hypothetical protein